VRMAQYCSLEEAWGNIPTEDWNSPAGQYNTPKQHKHRKAKQLSMNEKNTRRNAKAYKEARSARPADPAQFTSPALLQGSSEDGMSMYGPVNFDSKPQADGGVVQEAMRPDSQQNGSDGGTDVQSDDMHEPRLHEHQSAEMSESDLLKNQVSYLTTKVEQLTKLVQENMEKPVDQNRQPTDLILFVAAGLFFILVLDLFFRAGARNSAG
jgi:hypothetical protein